MADISDITALLVDIIDGIVYPTGDTAVGIPGTPARVQEGWPLAAQLELDMQGKMLVGSNMADTGIGSISVVSVYPHPGSAGTTFQVLNKPYVIVPPVHGMAVVVSGETVTVTGTPTTGEFLTLIVEGSAYSRGGVDVPTVLAALLADVQVDYPSASLSGNVLTLPAGVELEARQGAQATMGQVVHRQRQLVCIGIWAPDQARRSLLSGAIDVALKADYLRLTLPDTSEAIMVAQRTVTVDEFQTVAIYRRELVFSVEYGTVEQWTAYEVTSVTSTADPSGGSPGAPTVTVTS